MQLLRYLSLAKLLNSWPVSYRSKVSPIQSFIGHYISVLYIHKNIAWTKDGRYKGAQKKWCSWCTTSRWRSMCYFILKIAMFSLLLLIFSHSNIIYWLVIQISTTDQLNPPALLSIFDATQSSDSKFWQSTNSASIKDERKVDNSNLLIPANLLQFQNGHGHIVTNANCKKSPASWVSTFLLAIWYLKMLNLLH